MKVLLLGTGAREHALAWKLQQSPRLTRLTVAGGNAGLAQRWECRAVPLDSGPAVVALARELAAELVVIGPEAPLVAGVADALKAAGIAVFGPVAAAARLEGSKAFAKEVMEKSQVPTARWELFDDLERAAARAEAWGAVVVKADGLAAGKGVVVADDGPQAAAAVRALGTLPSGKRLLLEERLTGPEVSVMAFCDGERYALLPASQDHKRLLDADLGPNTGGMGAYAPAPVLDARGLEAVGRDVIARVLRTMTAAGTPFQGVLYAGLMLTPQGPRVLEFNVRLGDPETQPLMMQLDEDLLELCVACAEGKLEARTLKVHSGVSVGVVLAARGYPEKPVLGDEISGLESVTGAQVFHAGTRREGEKVVTSGGRVLTVCARGDTFEAARDVAYAQAAKIRFEGMQYRRDIGKGARPG
ncbi:MAG: phosphoribosylamine--glycine ligase [Archangiaceae bacterium]|nr:phosphoribosylamine--glycine ligase [Archangiaceae bacterium]